MNIERARVEIVITAKRCTIINGDGEQKAFQKSLSRWVQETLEYIEDLLNAYNRL